MSETIRVRVKRDRSGFIYGKRRGEDGKGNMDEFTLRPVTHSTKTDKDGELLVIPAADQFSERWMEKVGQDPVEPEIAKLPSEMQAPDLKAALNKAGVDIPSGSKKKDLVKLLENHLSTEQRAETSI